MGNTYNSQYTEAPHFAYREMRNALGLRIFAGGRNEKETNFDGCFNNIILKFSSVYDHIL